MVPYVHDVLHRLKKIENTISIKVVFSAPNKLSSLRKASYQKAKKTGCQTEHREGFVDCIINAVYALPASCGKKYIWRCVNDRLREHANNVRNGGAS